MANRMIEGFDYLATADLPLRFNVVGSVHTVNASGRVSGNCLRQTAPGTASSCKKVFDSQATWFVGFAFRASALPTGVNGILVFWDGTIRHVTINIKNDGAFEFRRGASNGTLLATSTTAIVVNVWNYIEVKVTISDTVGVCEMKINGVTDTLTFVTGTSSTQDTRNAGNASANAVDFGADGNGSGTNFDWDDAYVNDATGGVDDTYWGDIKVVSKSVDGAGNSAQFTPSTGSNFQNVDDSTPNGDTDYNASSTVNHIDSFTTAALGYTGTVKGVELLVDARKTDAGVASLAPLWRISGTDYPGTGQALATEYQYIAQRYRVSPATSSAWTVSEIDGAETGYKRTA